MDRTEKVIEILRDIVECDEINCESDLKEDIGLDSIGLVTLLIEAENVFQIELDETDMDPFELKTVSDVVTMISQYCESSDEKVG